MDHNYLDRPPAWPADLRATSLARWTRPSECELVRAVAGANTKAGDRMIYVGPRGFRDKDVSRGINREIVRSAELPRTDARSSEFVYYFEV